MIKISQQELKDKLMLLGNRVPFIGLDVRTEPKMYAVSRPIVKIATVTGRAGAHVREAIGNRSWGERIEGTPLVAHKGNFYLEVEVTSVKEEKFLDKESGREVTKEEAMKRGYRDKPVDKEYQNANMRDFKLSSIKVIRLKGEEYEI